MDLIYPFQIRQFRSAYDYHWDSSFAFLGERHDFWEFVCVLEGEAEVVEDEKVYLLQPGSFVAHGPMEFHRIRSAGGTCPRVLVMSFFHTGVLPQRLKDGVFVLTAAEREEYEAVFRRIHSVHHGLETEPLLQAEAALAVSSFLLRLAHRHKPQLHLSQSPRAALYHQLIETMQGAVRENLTLPELAARCAISVSTMKNLFREYAGVSPKQYYARLRGQEAVRLLEAGLTLEETAEQLRFSSVSYFSLFFKNQFGAPPGQYKRTHR